MKKVLIGIGTCNKFEYVESHCFDSIRKQTYKNFDVLVIDNSANEKHYLDLLCKNPDFIIKHIPRAKYFRDVVALTRKEIIDYTINYDYLFFVDVDHILKPNTLEALLSHQKDFVTGTIGYLHRKETTIFKEKKIGVVTRTIAYSWKELDYAAKFEKQRLIEISSCGLACALIKTSFLIGIEFFVSHSTVSFGEDTHFCMDLRKKGVRLYCDLKIKPMHLHTIMPERMNRKNAIFEPFKLF